MWVHKVFLLSASGHIQKKNYAKIFNLIICIILMWYAWQLMSLKLSKFLLNLLEWSASLMDNFELFDKITHVVSKFSMIFDTPVILLKLFSANVKFKNIFYLEEWYM